mmetsp:Transcript_11675/g.25570  ORF Transcript_11675/g.25570 Transcript_11675/m.25570 type:complete len:381 (+) Transcript_11675:92-1234(+)|eukprot:CAMPEP_0172313286 /NCGR_PEP_ID=MMETSP1058-20130122/19941_1 /TAXON_ID=83371 /ORGANISM="Detonula confervacea, Strain CCMP 353" /LENGTH=380 /DNA_ID=CAMNT_0013026917 /DNA_START=43 /DNA_END=1185 /DNA_ORIENTATION=+
MSDGPPPAKKIRSCSSSESTPNLALDEATATTLLDAVRRYEGEATSRTNDANAEVASAKDDVLAAMETLKRAHERLGRVEAVAVEAAKSARAAHDYRSKWELQLIGKKSATAALSAAENDEEEKHVSFAVPQHHHHTEATSSSASSSQRRSRRKRIRVSEHGWGVYEGHLDSLGEPHGRGTVTWENGGKYDGEWIDGKANGIGTMDYGNGDKYQGGWKDGCRFGEGTHHFKDGGVYEGQWRNAAPDGQGKMTLKNGSHYEGAWKDGKWHGLGIVRPVNGGEWEGTFHMGKCTVGTLRRPNGELEIGRYDSVNPDDVKAGVWWSIDRRTIWIVEDGQKKEQIDESRALEMVAQIGVPLPMELQQRAPPVKTETLSPVKSEE